MKLQLMLKPLVWITPIVLGSIVLITGTLPNQQITMSSYEISNSKLASVFDGYTIVQVSDLHNKRFGKNQSVLIEKIKAQHPDLIVLTGDMVGSWVPNYDQSLIFIKEASMIAPVIVVDGNHDARLKTYPIQKQAMSDAGAIVLEDELMSVILDNESFNLVGLKERFNVENRTNPVKNLVDPQRFNLLLAHHPTDFIDYVEAGFDLTLTGHAHGGQWRFFGVGLYAPNDGLLPKYDAGLYTQDTNAMIVSRGLGESVLPLRLFNGPELVVITLKSN